jgi:glucokinase
MRTIDETVAEIEANGYANLADEEIEAYVRWKSEIAAAEATASETFKSQQAVLQAAAEGQAKLADAAIERFNEIVTAGVSPVALDFSEEAKSE